VYNMEHQEALKVWENLRDDEEEKLVYLAKFDGDVEKAKWAFIRDKTKTSSIGNITSSISLPTPILAVISGRVYFWKLWLLSVLIPNIVFKLWLVSPEATSLQNLKIVISIFFLYSIIATCLLIPAFLKLKKEKDKTWFIALIIIVFSLINLAFSIQPILALNGKSTSVHNQSTKIVSATNPKDELEFATINEKKCVKKINDTLSNYFLHFAEDHAYVRSLNLRRRDKYWPTFERFGDFSWAFNAIKSNGSRTVDSVLTSWQEIIYVEVQLSGTLFPLSQEVLKNHNYFRGFFGLHGDPRQDIMNIGFKESEYITQNIYYECLTNSNGNIIEFQSNSKIKMSEYLSEVRFKKIKDNNSFRRKFAWLFPSI
jgi:hypothetical protein